MVTATGGLLLSRRIARPSVEVYRVWTDPQLMRRWLVPGAMELVHLNADVRVGGSVEIAVRSRDGKHHRFSGIYTSLEPHARIEFTWTYIGENESLIAVESRVVVTLREIDGPMTEMTLAHDRLDRSMVRDAYEVGWSSCLNRMATLFEAPTQTIFTATHLAMQRRLGTTEIAQRVAEAIVHETLTDEDESLIVGCDRAFISSIDASGWPTVSFKGGKPGFMRVIDGCIVIPMYRGNGMALTLGNLDADGRIGLLFIDVAHSRRLRVQGRAMVDVRDIADRSDVDAAITIRPTHVFANCGRRVDPASTS